MSQSQTRRLSADELPNQAHVTAATMPEKYLSDDAPEVFNGVDVEALTADHPPRTLDSFLVVTEDAEAFARAVPSVVYECLEAPPILSHDEAFPSKFHLHGYEEGRILTQINFGSVEYDGPIVDLREGAVFALSRVTDDE